jgi:cell division protein FtsL
MEQQKESKGALIGSIIIVLVLIIGGIYFAKQAQDVRQDGANEIDQVLQEDADIQEIEEGEISDEVTDLEGTLEEIDLGDLDDLNLDGLEF